MPLKIRVKPEAKIFAGGAVLKNVGKRPADLLVLSDGPVLRDSYMMDPDEKDQSDAASVYFLIQVLYCFKGKGQPIDTLVVETLKSFGKLYPALAERVDGVLEALKAGDSFKALKLAHALLETNSVPADSNVPYAALLPEQNQDGAVNHVE
jgi:flagellar biosynthesis regulator FlbT